MRLSLTFCVLFSLLLDPGLTSAAQPVCIGYLKDGDLYSQCGGDSVRVTHTGDISDFAVVEDGSALAVEQEYTVAKTRDNEGTRGDCEVRVMAFTPAFKSRSLNHRCGQLRATCGTITLEEGSGRTFDLLRDKPLQISGYQRFRCSADRTVVAGWPDGGSKRFALGSRTKDVAPFAGDASVSPSGMIAYYTEASNDNSVCVFAEMQPPQCLKNADAFDRISVSDSGQSLFTTHIDGGCVYRRMKITRAKPPATGDDQCVGIATWDSASGKKIVEELAGHPQWLTEKAVQTLELCSHAPTGCVTP